MRLTDNIIIINDFDYFLKKLEEYAKEQKAVALYYDERNAKLLVDRYMGAIFEQTYDDPELGHYVISSIQAEVKRRYKEEGSWSGVLPYVKAARDYCYEYMTKKRELARVK